VAWDSRAECQPQLQGQSQASLGDRDCWGYVCEKGSFGIPEDWRFYRVFVKGPTDQEFRQQCEIKTIPNPTANLGWGQTLPVDKTSCFLTPTQPGEYQWYVVAGYQPAGTTLVNTTQSSVFRFATREANLTYVCSADGQQVTLSWPALQGATAYALRVDNQADSWNGQCTSLQGDFCQDKLIKTQYTFVVKPNQSYSWWLHPIYQLPEQSPDAPGHSGSWSEGEFWGEALQGATINCQTGGGGQQPTSTPISTPTLKFTPTPTPTPTSPPALACLSVGVYANPGDTTVLNPSLLKVGDRVYLGVNANNLGNPTQARVKINGGVNTAGTWCLGTNLAISNEWCVTTNRVANRFYLPFTLPGRGLFKVETMVYYQLDGQWH